MGNTGKAKARNRVSPRLREGFRDRFAVGNRLKCRVLLTVNFRVRASVWMRAQDRFSASFKVTCSWRQDYVERPGLGHI